MSSIERQRNTYLTNYALDVHISGDFVIARSTYNGRYQVYIKT